MLSKESTVAGGLGDPTELELNKWRMKVLSDCQVFERIYQVL